MQYSLVDYLSSVTDPELRISLTMYRLIEHSLTVERGRHRHTWLPRGKTIRHQRQLLSTDYNIPKSLRKPGVKQKYICVMSLSHHRNLCHWPLSQIWKIETIAKYIKLGLKIMEKHPLLSAVKCWGRVRGAGATPTCRRGASSMYWTRM